MLAQVVLAIGEQRVTSIITADAARALDLKKGDFAAAVVKATEAMIARFETGVASTTSRRGPLLGGDF